MIQECFQIQHIPTVVWGKPSSKVIIAVHGNMSHKRDIPIEILASIANEKGYQVISFDLAQHGDRKNEGIPCKVQNSVEDLKIVMEYVQARWSYMSLFANSIGAYFSLLAYFQNELEKVLFLSPVVDMQHLINHMMIWFDISKQRLEKEQIVETPIGQTLYWDYYCYVIEHPIIQWNIPTYILYGNLDNTVERKTIEKFTQQFSCQLEIVESEHYFHTSKQLRILEEWIDKIL